MKVIVGKSAGINPDISKQIILLIFKGKFVIQGGFSPVYVACQKGHTDVVDLLVKAGADIDLATTEVYMYITLPSKTMSPDKLQWLYTCVWGNKNTIARTSSVYAYCMGHLSFLC